MRATTTISLRAPLFCAIFEHMSLSLKVIRDGLLPAVFNMAADCLLLDRAAQSDEITLRFYGWSPWAVSLGTMQRETHLDLDALSRNTVDRVRRPTGGRAILHANDITYSCVFSIASFHYGEHHQRNVRAPQPLSHERSFNSGNCLRCTGRIRGRGIRRDKTGPETLLLPCPQPERNHGQREKAGGFGPEAHGKCRFAARVAAHRRNIPPVAEFLALSQMNGSDRKRSLKKSASALMRLSRVWIKTISLIV